MLDIIDMNQSDQNHLVLFDTSVVYGNEYAEVHLRIKPDYYFKMALMYNNEYEGNVFEKEMTRLISKIGWKIDIPDRNEIPYKAFNENEYLYLFLNEFTGVILKDHIALLAKLFTENDKFPLESFYVYETIYDIPDDTYRRYLDSKQSYILAQLCELANIENCLVESGSLVQKVVFQFGVPRIQDNAGLFHHMEYTYRYVEECLHFLVNQGFIHRICREKRTYCRTEKARELIQTVIY